MSLKTEYILFWGLTGIAIVIFIFMVWIAIINKGSQQSYQLLKPILAGAAVSLFLLISILATPLHEYSKKIDVLILAKENGQVLPLENLTLRKFSSNPNSLYWHGFPHDLDYWKINHKGNQKIEDIDLYILDFVEWSTFTWISSLYPRHWQIERETFQAISAGSGLIGKKENAEKEVTSVFIVNILEGNRFTDFYKNTTQKDSKIYLPNNSKVIYEKVKDGFHKVHIKNKYVAIEISFIRGSGGMIHASDLAEKLLENFGPSWNQQVKVIFKITPNKLRRWSPKTQQQIEWIKQLSVFYEENSSWNNLKKKLEDSLEIKGYWLNTEKN